jgi:aminoglycoside phosphotransferase (APT) family kinase protein
MGSTTGLAALDALDEYIDVIQWLKPCLVHEDFWAGNTVWYRGRLTGVIDWSEARLGDRRLDPSQCRVDALLAAGVEVSDALLNAYEAIEGGPLPDQWYFDLLMGVRALVYLKYWMRGYHDAGLTSVTLETGREALEAFLRRAMMEADSLK